MSIIPYKEIIEETDNREIYFFIIHSGHFTDYFDDDYCYKIMVLDGQLRIMSNGEKDESFYFQNKVIEISCGEKFKLQNISSNVMKLLIVKFKLIF